MANVVDLTPRKRVAVMAGMLDGRFHRMTICPFDLTWRGDEENDADFFRRCLVNGAVELDGHRLDVATLSDIRIKEIFWFMVHALKERQAAPRTTRL
jgi:hypothetical protein